MPLSANGLFCYFPSSSSTSSFILYIFPSTNTSTSYRPYIDSRLNFFQHSFVNSETVYNHNHVYIAFRTPHFNCFPSTTTTATFLFFPSTTTTTFLSFPSTTTTTATFLLFLFTTTTNTTNTFLLFPSSTATFL